MTDIQETMYDFSLEDLERLLKRNFAKVHGDDNEDTAMDMFFDNIVEAIGNDSNGYAGGLCRHAFYGLEYSHPDEQTGDGPKRLIFKVRRSHFHYDYTNPRRSVYEGIFRITGWYDSWDNGLSDGYWSWEFEKVIPKEVTETRWVTA